jgi:hypothetical protein
VINSEILMGTETQMVMLKEIMKDCVRKRYSG